ncbi:hypothetical protein GKZ68_09145 [Hymenobacter sp. BRD128]|uniref:hypothetical protein n=1 Tax=Hymenobacter sp. BRD128 TaxID=2675878 RepID=UPI00156439BC|nr:hypothetical protein [Hymenobacter sp. BRD128]QKG56770.1 hypothetical protein GKZ68_09145 [Hymenobacter sp. BRD128]
MQQPQQLQRIEGAQAGAGAQQVATQRWLQSGQGGAGRASKPGSAQPGRCAG